MHNYFMSMSITFSYQNQREIGQVSVRFLKYLHQFIPRQQRSNPNCSNSNDIRNIIQYYIIFINIPQCNIGLAIKYSYCLQHLYIISIQLFIHIIYISGSFGQYIISNLKMIQTEKLYHTLCLPACHPSAKSIFPST